MQTKMSARKVIKMECKVTIITVTLNLIKNKRRDMFIQCVESVHNQSYQNIEHIIIDGASDDGTLKILEKYASIGWISYYSEWDDGIYQAMNRGIGKASGKYVAFLNSDDYYHNSEAVGESVLWLEKENADFSVASWRRMTQEGVWYADQKPQMGYFFMELPFCHQTMFTRKETLFQQGLFNENYKIVADYDLCVKLLLLGCKYVEVPSSIVSCRDGGESQKNRAQSLHEKITVYKEQFGRINEKYKEDVVAEKMLERKCRADLFHDLTKMVSKRLGEDMQSSILKYLPDEDAYLYSERKRTYRKITNERNNPKSKEELQENVDCLLYQLGINSKRADKLGVYFLLMNNWLSFKNQGKSMQTFFRQKGYKSIAIYGLGEIGKRLLEELKGSDIRICYAIDQAIPQSIYYGIPMLPAEEMLLPADVIIVTVVWDYRDIRKALKKRGNIPIISIEEVLDSSFVTEIEGESL